MFTRILNNTNNSCLFNRSYNLYLIVFMVYDLSNLTLYAYICVYIYKIHFPCAWSGWDVSRSGMCVCVCVCVCVRALAVESPSIERE
jgi:hypothetical protein